MASNEQRRRGALLGRDDDVAAGGGVRHARSVSTPPVASDAAGGEGD